MPQLHLEHCPDQPAIELSHDETLLQALHRAGIIWREACLNGVCGVCACHLKSGSVHYATRKPHGLTSQEQQQGQILPCIALPASEQLLLGKPSYPVQHQDLNGL